MTRPRAPRPPAALLPVEMGLTAAIVAVNGERPLIVTARGEEAEGLAALPSGPFDPVTHRTLEIGLRAWVAEQTGAPIGYVEQLYTFGDRGRHAQAGDVAPHVVSVGYLALTRVSSRAEAASGFRDWHEFFPWEDWREGRPAILDAITPRLDAWAKGGPGRMERVGLSFGRERERPDEERTLERYELLYEAGLVEEAWRDGRVATRPPAFGQAMRNDHRRILATAMGRLRAKLKYRPVVFELMAPSFTLTALQRTVEAISGRRMHKQNFRRLVESTDLVEPTGDTARQTGGRPAALYRFRGAVVAERPAPGLRV
jgi:hypothetical protein